ncbi:DUF3892 domain-containing protein [Candidatus Pacearchaeota archaeon]|nr:DUF3892 domain-containing protein [Candidatus Pacearchaeota archaeon]
MGTYKVKCVDVKNDCSFRDCRCVKFIGIPTTDGGTNKYTPLEIYNRITKGDEFYVENNGKKTFLIKAEREGTKYVKTEQNDTENDNLLKQKSCSV